MSRLVCFPATAGGAHKEHMQPVSRQPVLRIDEGEEFNESAGGMQRTFRLSIGPWDLQRVVREANRLGLAGQEVVGFGYDPDSQVVRIGPSFDQASPRAFLTRAPRAR